MPIARPFRTPFLAASPPGIRACGPRIACAILLTLCGCAGSAATDDGSPPERSAPRAIAPAIEPGYRLDLSTLEPARDTVLWSAPDLATRRFDRIEVRAPQTVLGSERIEDLGVTAAHAGAVIEWVAAEWRTWTDAFPPLVEESPTDRNARTRTLQIVTRFTDRNHLPTLDTDGSAIDATGDRLARVCLVVEFHDPGMRETVAAFISQRDAHHFEAILRGEHDAALTRRILRPRLRALAAAIRAPSANDTMSGDDR